MELMRNMKNREAMYSAAFYLTQDPICNNSNDKALHLFVFLYLMHCSGKASELKSQQ